MNKYMTQEVAIKSAWMILEGLGFIREINGDLEKTVAAVYESAPAADVVEVRHGKFLGTEFGKYDDDGCPVYYEWICSECRHVFEGEEPKMNYCPNCGVRWDL